VTPSFPKSFEAVEVFIRGFLPGAKIKRVGEQQLRLDVDSKIITLPLGLSWLQDFEVALEGGGVSKRYTVGLRDDMYFAIYALLGMEGRT
jgi:hypothetical protein